MLQIKKISKKYQTGDFIQVALDQVTLDLRDQEFVAILGPSGSGKTTLLNIIGGLDRYDSGDLVINNKSTKTYKDRDWDTYRNHTIGFVFQNYNLIPHQSVLANVELALTISGIGRKEKKQRAKNALEKVGLGDQIHKKPNQLSGGQMQRVAIARALVNNPEILLADEPTGALDSETSLQVMDLLKEVAADRLVIMVTHNSDLAKKYASRIINLQDGKVINDSDPFHFTNNQQLDTSRFKNKASMSFLTSLTLSFNNLRTKLGRTFLTSFAGSIGIIGIALIIALSSGVNAYINKTQTETMASYPLTIDKETVDLSAIFQPKTNSENKKKNTVFSSSSDRQNTSSNIVNNDLKSFKKYLDNKKSKIHKYIGKNGIIYNYDTKYKVYSYDKNNSLINADKISQTAINSPLITNGSNFEQLIKGKNQIISSVIKDNYQLKYGNWPKKYNEVVLVLNSEGNLATSTLYQLGYITANQYQEIQTKLRNKEMVTELSFSYQTLINKTFTLIPSVYFYQKQGSIYLYSGDDPSVASSLLDKGFNLKVSGIIQAKSSETASIKAPVAYTYLLTDKLIAATNSSSIIKEQEANKTTNLLTGTAFNQDLTYETLIAGLGKIDYAAPSSINIYTDSFKDKEGVTASIADYNKSVSNKKKITYTDYIKMLTSSITSIISIISTILIAFAAISLIVSSIMIGIITHISVLERTKEIGILRALGASKRNISQVFNAETLIIGALSGILGILITNILLIPINTIINQLFTQGNITAVLPLNSAVFLIIISILITIIGGLFPAGKAARKDPVIALRTE